MSLSIISLSMAPRKCYWKEVTMLPLYISDTILWGFFSLMEEIKRPDLQCNLRILWEHESKLTEDLTGRPREGKVKTIIRSATPLGKKNRQGQGRINLALAKWLHA